MARQILDALNIHLLPYLSDPTDPMTSLQPHLVITPTPFGIATAGLETPALNARLDRGSNSLLRIPTAKILRRRNKHLYVAERELQLRFSVYLNVAYCLGLPAGRSSRPLNSQPGRFLGILAGCFR